MDHFEGKDEEHVMDLEWTGSQDSIGFYGMGKGVTRTTIVLMAECWTILTPCL